jgi:hypothetical protein
MTTSTRAVLRRTRSRRPEVRLRQLGVGTLAIWFVCGYIAVRAVMFFASRDDLGSDAHAYWLTGHHADLYSAAPRHADAYLYSPLFAQLIWPLTQLPWPVFLAVWMAAATAAYAWLVWPLGLEWGVPALLLCTLEVGQGNILGFIGAAAVIGMTRPSAWAFPLLTKVTTGLGPVWFAVRREWRALVWSLGVTAALAAVSIAFSVGAWADWIHFLATNRGGDATLPYRLVAGLTLTVIAARRNQAWLLAPAILLASPVLHGWMYLSLLATVPRLLAFQRQRSD